MNFSSKKLLLSKKISIFGQFILTVLLLTVMGCSPQQNGKTENISEADILMQTSKGDIYISLFDATPNHKSNFIKLAEEGFFDDMAFHRIVNNFVIQAGDPRTKPNSTTKEDDAGYTIPAEIVDTLLHTAGRLSAARYPDNVNPTWASSSSQFFIVTGKVHTSKELDNIEDIINNARETKLYQEYAELLEQKKISGEFNDFLADRNFTYFGYTDDQRESYLEGKGAPMLDLQYTVFGEVVKGMDVVRQIELTPTRGEQPLESDSVRIHSVKSIVGRIFNIPAELIMLSLKLSTYFLSSPLTHNLIFKKT